MIVDSGFDGIEAWIEVISEDPDPERKKRLRKQRSEYVERVREDGKEWLQKEINRKRKALKSLRERFERADQAVYDNADVDDPTDDLDLEDLSAEEQAERIREAQEQARGKGEGAVWAGDEVPEPLVRRRNELRRKHRRGQERLSVLRAVRDKIEADGLPSKKVSSKEAVPSDVEAGRNDEEIRERIEESTKEQKNLARVGLQIYEENKDCLENRHSLLEAMVNDDRCPNVAVGTLRKSRLGPLYIDSYGPGPPKKEERLPRLKELVNLWAQIEE